MTSLYPLVTIIAFGLIASACSSTVETSETGGDQAAEEVSDIPATADVTIEGDALPPMDNESDDPAVGLIAPEITGTDLNGEPVSITADGRAKVIYFIAHWCPHCQEEVPVLAELIDTGQQPENLDIYAISTVVDEDRENFPPSEWLEGAGFQAPTIRDNENSEALIAYGAGGFPYAVFLDADHKVVNRTAGQLGPEEIVKLWEETAG